MTKIEARGLTIGAGKLRLIIWGLFFCELRSGALFLVGNRAYWRERERERERES